MTRGHPIRLWWFSIIYAAQMCAYGLLLTNLLPFARDALALGENHALWFFAAFASLSWIISIIGGILCDYIGFKSTALVGLLSAFISLQFLSHAYSTPILYLGTAVFILSQGLSTAAIWSLVSQCYNKNSKTRASGTTLFYLIFNIGAFLGIFSSGFWMTSIGYHSMFFYLSFILLMAFIICLFIRTKERKLTFQTYLRRYSILVVISILLIAISCYLLNHPFINNFLIIGLTILSILYLYTYGKISHHSKKPMHLSYFVASLSSTI